MHAMGPLGLTLVVFFVRRWVEGGGCDCHGGVSALCVSICVCAFVCLWLYLYGRVYVPCVCLCVCLLEQAAAVPLGKMDSIGLIEERLPERPPFDALVGGGQVSPSPGRPPPSPPRASRVMCSAALYCAAWCGVCGVRAWAGV